MLLWRGGVRRYAVARNETTELSRAESEKATRSDISEPGILDELVERSGCSTQ
jgi:hypothetical protein